MKLRLSEDYSIDTDDYRKEGLRIAIVAMSGHGKSNAAADIIEDVLDQQGQTIILEPITEWHTLKARYNNIVTVGGQFQDLPLEPEFAKEYVHASLENGVNLVVNVSDLEQETDQRKFVANFLWNLYRSEQKYRRVVFLAIEEADTWAPQMWDQSSKESLSRVSLIAKHGRKIGLFPIFITQRPADFHKSPLSQCNVILFGKFTSPADLDSKTGVMYVLKTLHIPIEEKDIINLKTSEFIAWDIFGVHKVKVRKRSCPHGADTPLVAPIPFAPGVNQTLDSLKESIEKALAAKKREKSEIDRLTVQLEAARGEIQELKKRADIKISLTEMFKGEDASKEMLDLKAKTEKGEVNVEKDLKKAQEEKELTEKRINFLETKVKSLTESLDRAEEDLKLFDELTSVLRRMLPPEQPTTLPSANISDSNVPSEVMVTQEIPNITVVTRKPTVQVDESNWRGRLILLIAKGYFDESRRLTPVRDRLKQDYGTMPNAALISNELVELVKMHLLKREQEGGQWVYMIYPGAKERVKTKETEA